VPSETSESTAQNPKEQICHFLAKQNLSLNLTIRDYLAFHFNHKKSTSFLNQNNSPFVQTAKDVDYVVLFFFLQKGTGVTK